MLLSLSCYKRASHYFLLLLCTLCTHTCHVSLLICFAAQKMKNSLLKTSSRHTGHGHLPVAWCHFMLFSPE
jgi:hypothetical protein